MKTGGQEGCVRGLSRKSKWGKAILAGSEALIIGRFYRNGRPCCILMTKKGDLLVMQEPHGDHPPVGAEINTADIINAGLAWAALKDGFRNIGAIANLIACRGLTREESFNLAGGVVTQMAEHFHGYESGPWAVSSLWVPEDEAPKAACR